MNRIFANLPNTIFDVMSQAARDLNAINLGQGFPDDPGPLDIREKAADAVLNGYNQYPSMMGIPELRKAVAAHYGHWHGLALDPMSEVMVTSGATEALTGSILGLVEPGDEVLVFQPMYDSYVPIIRLAGGVPKFLRLEPPHWRLPEDAIRAAITPKTRYVMLNNPLNPAAVVYPREDLETGPVIFRVDELAGRRVEIRHRSFAAGANHGTLVLSREEGIGPILRSV